MWTLYFGKYILNLAQVRSLCRVVDSILDLESGGVLGRRVLRQDIIYLAHTVVYDDWHTTLCRIASHLSPLIHVERLSVTCIDGLRAPVLGTIKERVVRIKLIVC